MRKILIAVSNHPPETWPEEQKAGWDEIVYIPFPNVPAELDREDVWLLAENLASEIAKIFDIKSREGNQVRLWIAGDYSLTIFTIYEYIRNHWGPYPVGIFFDWLVFPTTERIVIEEKNSDGNIVKKSVFKFVKWR